jgi:hypothetical protein
MATSSGTYPGRDSLGRTAPLVAGIATYTLLLTAAFLGVVGLVSGEAAGLLARMPMYVLASSISFIAVLLIVDGRHRNGIAVLGRAVAAALATFVLVTLGAEGAMFALTRPGSVVASHLFVYLLSAAIIASGLGYWGVRNWHDVRGAARGNLLR